MTQFNESIFSTDGVTNLHALDDLDIGPLSHHHSLGVGPNNSAFGNHTHNGSNSPLITIAAAKITAWPKAELRQTAAQALTTATWTSLNQDTEDIDNMNGHSGVNPSRYISQLEGWYLCQGLYAPVSNVTGIRGCRLSATGTTVPASWGMVQAITTGSSMGIHSRAKLVFLTVGAYVEAQGFQNSGGNLNTQATGEAACSLTVVYQGAS